MLYKITHKKKWFDDEEVYMDTLDEVVSYIKTNMTSQNKLSDFTVVYEDEVDVYDLMNASL
jgi:uncharacterized protein YeeX (DUF496 family)